MDMKTAGSNMSPVHRTGTLLTEMKILHLTRVNMVSVAIINCFPR